MRQIAVNIRRARLAKGHTQESLARALDVGVRVVQSWEGSGEAQRIPRARNLQALASELEQHPSWFYAEHDEQPVAA